MQKVTWIGLLIIPVILFISCTDKKTEDEYFKLAYEQYNQEKYQESIDNFKKIIEYYPDGENAPKAIFMIGFINANNTENFEEAKQYYTLFIETYPDHDLSDDAKYELNTLGQDINDLPIFDNADSSDVQAKNE